MADIFDLIVIGAGWYGLAAAKAYIELHPDEKILITEAGSSFGGTWSKERLYAGLKSNNLKGSYEHPDFPMSEDVYGVKSGQHIPAETLHRYLSDLATKFGIAERTRFNMTTTQIESRPDDTWFVTMVSKQEQEEVLHSKKLIVATGLTSQPNLPTYAGQETFTPAFFHAKDFCARGDILHTAKKAAVVGAGKSSFDVAYAFATSGAKVDLIIRPTGQGPVWICPPYVTPFKRMMEELLSTRLLTWFSPVPWGDEDGFGVARSFLHKTGIGRFIVDNFWNQISNEVYEAHGYHDHPELFKLKPWNSAFWTGSGVGIHNYPTNFFDLVKQGQIRVHIADIKQLEGNYIQLTTGEKLDTDALICATGWKKGSGLKFVNFDTGLQKTEAQTRSLIDQADKEVRDMFPILRAQPVLRTPAPSKEPLRNYRFIVPTQSFFKRNIAFAGMVSTVTTAVFANAQGLWISAYLDGKLERTPKNQEEVIKKVMLDTQFQKWRYPCGYGASIPDFAFDSIPYVDLLLNDLGIKPHRKSTQITEIMEPYKPRDYKGLTQQWLESHST
ncbi:putative dimethylaniline monooxygenase [Talaromyces proteolyticus]|uniref:Dimethylaniline monooxygenase n=1 Tax=Talaromyces proteolyticus TaxID=1131652 RepID=A0AAD4L028_9EURO|nr:putative dimethylaniline monooxygenase [Talaromyces proteolyticus]KAH8703035.1 putative dimethylaniline monooxygenase [Talaromyces proteolyticus]